ncbi:MAG: GGDEF domain-containing protein [Alphaproteobacteria bacterium]|nr:GGDEF domain-containing protein [Alphaproteobacteria bacterium]
MEDDEEQAVGRAMPVGDRQAEGGDHQRPARRYQNLRGSGLRSIRDAATILGIPDVFLTPHVRESIASMMGELDSTRQEIDRLRGREAFLEEEAERDPVAPILGRRGVMRELGRLLAYGERSGMPGALASVHVEGLDAIRRFRGNAAGDAALAHVAAAIGSVLRKSDVIGHLDGGAFLVILTVAEPDAAAGKSDQLARAIESPAFEWRGEMIPLAARIGVVPFRGGRTAEEMLVEADEARL